MKDELKKITPKGMQSRRINKKKKRKSSTTTEVYQGMPKRTFLKFIELLELSEQRSQEAFDIGIDTFEFERTYLDAIEVLMMDRFDTLAMDLIHVFVYGIPYSNSFEDVDQLETPNSVDELWEELINISQR